MGHKHHKYYGQNPGRHLPSNHGKLPTGPAPQAKKSSFLGKLRDKIREPPATKEEVEQLGLNAKRETYKTQIARAKQSRPSRLDRLLSGGPAPRGRIGRVSYPRGEDNSFLMGGNPSGDSFLTSSSGGEGLMDMVGAGHSSFKKGKKQQRSGLEELF